MIVSYLIIALLLVCAELLYFRIADHFDIVDKPKERSSHAKVVLRGGGIVFIFSIIMWYGMMAVQGNDIVAYLPFLCGLLLISGVSFWDDIRSLPNSVRLMIQFVAMALMFWSIALVSGSLTDLPWYGFLAMGVVALIVFVGATDVINFMDGINGITAGYSLAVLLPLVLVNRRMPFIEESYLIVAILGVLVFSFFNFRPQGKAKCFAGDVGSIGIAFIMLFAIGTLIARTGDATWMLFLLVYGVDGCCTIVHRIQLHENLGEAHRKHAYQLMANELKMSHMVVSLIYLGIQLAISLVMIYCIPNTVLAHWIYLLAVAVVLISVYLVFMTKYYHLHAAYLESLKTKSDESR